MLSRICIVHSAVMYGLRNHVASACCIRDSKECVDRTNSRRKKDYSEPVSAKKEWA